MLAKVLAFWRSPQRRPVWQMIALLPVFLFYVPARKFVDWVDHGPF